MGPWSYVAPRFATALRELSPEDQRQDGESHLSFYFFLRFGVEGLGFLGV